MLFEAEYIGSESIESIESTGSLSGCLGSFCNGVINIQNPKNRWHLGREQFIVLRDSSTIRLVEWLLLHRSDSDKLWAHSKQRLLDCLHLGLRLIHCSNIRLTLGCFRPGGATQAMLSNWDFKEIQYFGRWASEKSLAGYLQEAVAGMIQRSITLSQSAHIALVVDASALAWERPPRKPFVAIFTEPRRISPLHFHRFRPLRLQP